MIHPTAIVDAKAEIGKDVQIGPYSVVNEDVKIGSGTVIGSHAVIDTHTTIGENCRISQFASIGAVPQDLKFRGEITFVEIGDNTVIREFVTVNRGTAGGGGMTRIGAGSLLMAYVHAAHDCIVGKNAILANCATLAGHVVLGDHVSVGGMTAVQQFVRIGDHAYIGGQCGVRNDIPPYVKAAGGEKMMLAGINTIGLGRWGYSEETISILKATYRKLFRSKGTVKEGIEVVRAEFSGCPEAMKMIEFIESSKLGITR
ncbi:MAG: acyl-ACP--UDP-N-acetylglucosamine O-acyltransferase [Desulfobacteraceae bacterium]|nr:acyl-ACP--UDP-N-acetylglucosamine O-acyltransferase [Desulfobacteraceae bacterium]MBU4054203.1 acyl-ACP--UDP-N-acetylglucosamine O-acyltransferase [Pseudomonadota bacterium]